MMHSPHKRTRQPNQERKKPWWLPKKSWWPSQGRQLEEGDGLTAKQRRAHKHGLRRAEDASDKNVAEQVAYEKVDPRQPSMVRERRSGSYRDEKKRTFQDGEDVIWTRHDRGRNRSTEMIARVVRSYKGGVEIKLDNGSTQVVARKNLKKIRDSSDEALQKEAEERAYAASIAETSPDAIGSVNQ